MTSITDIQPSTKVCALIGNPVAHSMSPSIHNRAFSELGLDYVYVAFRVENVGAAMAGMRALENFRGLSVTIPHKVSIIERLDDIAEVAVAALTEPGHAEKIYEVTGPRLMTFADIASELSKVSGREIAYVQIPHEAFISGLVDSGAPKEVIWLLDYLFSTVLDGRNAYLTDGIERALGRSPKDFSNYAREVAATGGIAAVVVAATGGNAQGEHAGSRERG